MASRVQWYPKPASVRPHRCDANHGLNISSAKRAAHWFAAVNSLTQHLGLTTPPRMCTLHKNAFPQTKSRAPAFGFRGGHARSRSARRTLGAWRFAPRGIARGLRAWRRADPQLSGGPQASAAKSGNTAQESRRTPNRRIRRRRAEKRLRGACRPSVTASIRRLGQMPSNRLISLALRGPQAHLASDYIARNQNHMIVAAPAKKPAASPVEDVQGHSDTRRIPINKVGIKDIYHPVKVKDRATGEQHTVANFNMYVNLPHNFKGTHMSRFVEILHRHEREISVDSFGKMLEEMTEHLDASAGHIEMTFPYFVMK